MSKCKLCLEESELMNSHIIPEYFYTPMYDSKHRFMQLSTEPEKSTTFKQKGIREYLLCSSCEQKFSLYEQYVSQLFFHKGTRNFNQDDKKLIAEGVDYSLMKLFQMSILWRASISSLEIFGDVQLGAHENILRELLKSESPGRYYEYGCIQIAIIMEKDKIADGLVMPPALFAIDGFKICRFVFGGMVWIYLININNDEYKWKKFFLSEEGKLLIYKSPIEDIKFIIDFGLEMKKKGNI